MFRTICCTISAFLVSLIPLNDGGFNLNSSLSYSLLTTYPTLTNSRSEYEHDNNITVTLTNSEEGIKSGDGGSASNKNLFTPTGTGPTSSESSS